MKTFAKANGNLKNCPSLGRGTSNAVAEGVSYVYKGVPLGKASLITVPLTEEGQAKRREFPYVYKGVPLGKASLITVPLTEEGRAVYGGGSSPIFTNEHR